VVHIIHGVTYTINDINVRCAQLMGYKVIQQSMVGDGRISVIDASDLDGESYRRLPQYCTDPNCMSVIVDYCFSNLLTIEHDQYFLTKWEWIMSTRDCSKLMAACICFIESHKQELTHKLNADNM
jgi:hypothetical protein